VMWPCQHVRLMNAAAKVTRTEMAEDQCAQSRCHRFVTEL